MDGGDGRRGRWAGWTRRIAAAPYAPAVAGVLLPVLAVAESVARARGMSSPRLGGFSETVPVGEAIARTAAAPPGGGSALYLVVLPLLGLATTLPVALLRGQPVVAAVLAFASSLLSLGAFRTLTAAGVAAQLIAGYRLGRTGSPRTALLLAAPYPVLALADPAGGELRVLILLLACLAPAAALAGIARRAQEEALANTAAHRVIADTLLEHTARGERARIARELHDVVAHHISMVAVQAETARLATPGMPAAGAERLRAIGDTARAALTEMRRLLGVLREDTRPESPEPGASAGPGPDRRPQPGLRLRELNELLDESRDASGTGTRLILRGSPVTLDPGVELAAYRIVQEALTNTRRHAPGAAVDVELHYTAGELRLLVRDNGPGSAAATPDGGQGLRPVAPGGGQGLRPVVPADGHGLESVAAGGGHGLAGMRERAAAVGGELRTGPAEGGGFLVEARLPGKEQSPA